MIIITGAAGFIGSNMVRKLNDEGFFDLVLVDKFTNSVKTANYENKKYTQLIDRDALMPWIDDNHRHIEAILHIGARTDTAEFDTSIFDTLNLNYSKHLWTRSTQYGIPLLYASSAATYGLGELGYIDEHAIINNLKPLNPYGESKNDFDKWVLKQEKTPPFWAGFKFFNVYGPNEYHKGRMASVIFHTFNQINKTGGMKLFKSHHPDYKDGEQKRDFVYVKDVCSVLYFFLIQRQNSGIYNLGTGKARTFLDLATNTFQALNLSADISFIDTPADIRDKYQYFTEANMKKLRKAGYNNSFYSLEQGITEYVQEYLKIKKYN